MKTGVLVLIRQAQPQVIALTSFSEEHMVQGALRAGAIGYLQKYVTVIDHEMTSHSPEPMLYCKRSSASE